MFGYLRRQVKAIQIVTKDEKTGSFKLASKTVKKLLQSDKVKDIKICVIAVAGAFRKGKSYLLNFFVKYLEAACEREHDLENWLDADNNESTGFAWRGGSERETTGIWAFDKVFILKKMEGSDTDSGQADYSEEIAVVLLDTQGTFDHDSSTHECTTIFALATLISSILIFNLSQNIQENDLQHLQLFAEYGRKAAQTTRETNDKPFQSLMFLVRDWPNPCEYAFGLDGGRKFLKKKLAISGKHSDLTDVRKGIQDCFNDISCCLFPYPGSTIATYNKGCKLSDADEEFRNHVKKFVESISSVDNLIKKKIDGQEITCGNLVLFLKSYVEAFEGGRIPSVRTLLQTTAIANHLAALEHTKTQFMKDIKEMCGANVPYMDPIKLDHKLSDLKAEAESTFEDYSKVRDQAINEQYLGELSNFTEETCREYTKANGNKANLFNKVRTLISKGINDVKTLVTSAKATAEANNLAAAARAKDKYTKDIENVCGGDKPYLSPDELKKKHNQFKEAAIIRFRKVRMMEETEYSQGYEEQLSAQLEESYKQYIKHNDSKKPFYVARTPMVVFSVVMIIVLLFSSFCFADV